MSINKAVIAGNLTRDAELSETKGGMAVLKIGVAVNERKKDKATGEWEDYASFIDCYLYGERGRKLAGILGKGMKVCVIGRLHQDRWDDKASGKSRSAISITVDDIELMTRSPRTEQAEVRSYSAPDDYSAYDEDIPF